MRVRIDQTRHGLLVLGILLGLLLTACQPIVAPTEDKASDSSLAAGADLVGVWEWPARGALVNFDADGSYAVGQSPYDFAMGFAFDDGAWTLSGSTLEWSTADTSMFCAGMPAAYEVSMPSADELILVQESDACEQRSWGDGDELPPLLRTDIAIPTDVEEQEIAIDGKTLTLHCEGEGTTTIMLEAGIYDPWTVWWKVQPALAENYKVCSYTRAEAVDDEVRTGQDLAEDLAKLVEAADLEEPFILAAHSMGGYVARLFADQYGDKLAGLVLVDSSHEDELDQIAGVMPAEIYQEILEWETSMPDAIDLRASADQARGVTDLGDLPLVVVTAVGDTETDLPADVASQIDAIWQALHAQLAELSSQGKQILAEGSGHNVHLEQPEVVIAAIEEAITSARLQSK